MRGIVNVPSNLQVVWSGEQSHLFVGGAIQTFLSKQNIKTPIVFHQSDGIVASALFGRWRPGAKITNGDIACDSLESKQPHKNVLIAALCARAFRRDNLLLLPLDDDTFEHGLRLPAAPSYESRLAKVYWRGAASSSDGNDLRSRVVAKSLTMTTERMDVKLTPWGGWENGQNIPEHFFAPRVPLREFLNHKFILIVDGACISSNLQWVFGSGSVPIMITHPDNDFWFKKFLVPMQHYVPIAYDLSNFETMIDYLFEFPNEAARIAKKAQEFADHFFSASFQQEYLTSELKRAQEHNVTWMQENYIAKCRTSSDINEHLPVLCDYARSCTSVIECGTRTIVSAYAFAHGLAFKPDATLSMIDLEKNKHMPEFIKRCAEVEVHASFQEANDLKVERKNTDLLFIDTWHVYGQLKRELAYWHTFVNKWIILHDTTVDEWQGETIRMHMDARKQAAETGFPLDEIYKGLWPAVEEFLDAHKDIWRLEARFTNNNGLTVLRRIS
jgi:hypothetical protein